MDLNIKKIGDIQYIDEGQGQVMLLLHGLFGALSNWEGVVDSFSKDFRVLIPILPIYTMSTPGVDSLTDFVEEFVKVKEIKEPMIILGNSLGGHLALNFTLRSHNKDLVKYLLLTGSSGLFENSMGSAYPKRGSYDFVKERVQHTFYDPNVATDALIDEVFEITRNIPKCMNIVHIAKSAQRHNLATLLPSIEVPTLLIWGLNDTITPPLVAYEFDKLLPNAELYFIDKCGHAPMMEHPQQFNQLLRDFLARLQ